MKFKKLYYILTIVCAGFLLITTTSLSTGIGGQSTAGCTCHSPSPSGATFVALTGTPAGGYVNGQTYSLTLTVTNGMQIAAGFNMAVNVGTFSTSGTGTVVLGTQEMTHTAPKMMSSGTATWTLNWTAPATGNVQAIFDVAGNAVNLNGGNDIGDLWNMITVNVAAATGGATIPTITVGTPSGITIAAGTINGTVKANNASTTVSVEYGLTTAYGQTAATNPANVSGNTATPVNATLSGLAANTIYHYRIKAINSVGTSTSADATFKTLATNVAVQNIGSEDFQLFPNPAKNQLVLKTKDAVTIKITGMDGKTINAQYRKLASDKYEINIAELPTGVYLMILEGSGKTHMMRFSKI